MVSDDAPAPGSKAWHRMMDERYFPEEVAERDAAEARAAAQVVTRAAAQGRYASELDFQAFRAGLKDALPRREARFKDELLAELRPILTELAVRLTALEEAMTEPNR